VNSLLKATHSFIILTTLLACRTSIRAEESGASTKQASEILPVEQIVARMVAHGQWQKQSMLGYKALRRFQAANIRFGVESTMDVMTIFRQPESLESQVLAQEGSKFIRERVFDKILETEKDSIHRKDQIENGILPANYTFTLVGHNHYEGRKCYHLTISPKRKSRYLLNGFIWIDTEDFAIARISGSPSKRVNFWTLRTEVDRQYERVGNYWLTKKIDSTSDLFIAGHSTLSIASSYSDVQTNPSVADLPPKDDPSRSSPLPPKARKIRSN
jgi:hypothetical protein